MLGLNLHQDKAARALLDAAREEPGSPRDWLSGRAENRLGLDWTDPYHPKLTGGFTKQDIDVAFRWLVSERMLVKGPPSKTFGSRAKGQGYAYENATRFGWYVQTSSDMLKRE